MYGEIVLNRLFDNTYGCYLPAFLCIQLNDRIDFQNFESHSDEVKGTFTHEYCHFYKIYLPHMVISAFYVTFRIFYIKLITRR